MAADNEEAGEDDHEAEQQKNDVKLPHMNSAPQSNKEIKTIQVTLIKKNRVSIFARIPFEDKQILMHLIHENLFRS